jgi:hypothetical protein
MAASATNRVRVAGVGAVQQCAQQQACPWPRQQQHDPAALLITPPQAVYQMLDRGFVGLICSAFNASAASKAQTVQLTAFQAVPGGSGSAAGEAAAGGGGAVAGSGGAGASSPPLLLGASSAELDDQQLQAALAASAAGAGCVRVLERVQACAAGHVRGPLLPLTRASLTDARCCCSAVARAEQHEAARDSWQRREVPLSISQDSSNPSTLADYVEVQRMLLAEEEAAHAQLARTPSGGGGGGSSQVHTALLQLLDSAAHQQALLQQADCVLAPALMAMQQLQRQQALQARQLQADNQRLKVCGVAPACCGQQRGSMSALKQTRWCAHACPDCRSSLPSSRRQLRTPRLLRPPGRRKGRS